MAIQQIHLFATQSDLSALVNEVSGKCPLQLVVAGFFYQKTHTVLSDSVAPQPFVTYLAFGKGLPIVTRPVLRRVGAGSAGARSTGTGSIGATSIRTTFTDAMFAIDEIESPSAVVVRCGGLDDEHRLVASKILKTDGDEKSDEIYSLFATEIRNQFEEIKSCYVGPEAVRLLDRGFRLAPTKKSQEKFDLVR